MAQREFPDNRGKVLEAVDIVDVVGDSVSLKRKGSEYVGLCPFHDDHKPSMYVVPGKQIFHCFSCGAGGNAIDFVMRHHGLDFREALRALADKAGIELEQARRSGGTESASGSGVSRGELSDANAMAQSFFRAIFDHPQHGAVARTSAERRGISNEMIERFGIGASPDRFDGLLQTAQKRGVDQRVLLEAGLLKRSERGKVYDGFRNRLMFPIRDAMGRVIAFGARRLDEEDNPKYLNSPESDLFNKSRALFGLFEATKAIQRERTAIVTEGYTDVVACHQAGVEHAVAALGTAFTKEHARVLKRLCDRVVLLFDGDEAGQRAADRAIEAFFAEPIDVQIVVLPDGADPDDMLKQEGGRERFLALVAR
ncbi:MAG: DNA primase, partial [Planctomycetota bacterium]